MSHKSALASLTAQYTDSENEDDRRSDDNSDTSDTDHSADSQGILVQPRKSASPAPIGVQSSTSDTAKSTAKKPSHLRLVSYNDDNAVSDDGDDDDDEHDDGNAAEGDTEAASNNNQDSISMDISGGEDASSEAKASTDHASRDGESAAAKRDKATEYGFQLPPEPKGKCPADLQDKIANMHAKMKLGMDMNRLIQDRKEFRNPSIYEKLIQFCDINELGTNYPPEIYDPLQWGKESFYEELALAQKLEMEKRERDRKDNQKTELVMLAAKKAEEEAKRRKSKWDQPAPGATANATAVAAAAAVSVAKAAALVQPTFTANATGTKGTVISAFGSLPKKPKV